MVQGNWTCADCGAQITQLPFQPREDQLDTLKCRDCHRASRPARSNDRPRSGSDRPMVTGSWTCADCGKEITQLPFEPSGDRPVRCSDCHRASRPAREERRW
ncbi:MAG: hypothetical protein KBD24_00025 [Candidatus Pacebacteria bacterium]|nr:hypothetical protein [Candidatus Paceibacterota bacterium]